MSQEQAGNVEGPEPMLRQREKYMQRHRAKKAGCTQGTECG